MCKPRLTSKKMLYKYIKITVAYLYKSSKPLYMQIKTAGDLLHQQLSVVFIVTALFQFSCIKLLNTLFKYIKLRR